MNSARAKITAILSLILAALLSPALAAPPAGQRVLVTAHSFHIFTAKRMPALAQAAGIQGHQLVASQMIGGSSVTQHWELTGPKAVAKPALQSGNVDLMTMSPNFTVPDPAIEKFVDLGLKHNPNMRFFVQESWVGFDGHDRARFKNNAARDTRPLDEMRAANDRFKAAVEKQVNELNAKLGRNVVRIIPVGDAVLKLSQLVIEGKCPGVKKRSELHRDPIGHGTEPIMALATYCNFACLYGVNPIGLNDPLPELDKLSPDLKPLLQRLAWETVTAHPMSGVKSAP